MCDACLCVFTKAYNCMRVGSPTLYLAILFPEPVAVLVASISQDPFVDTP